MRLAVGQAPHPKRPRLLPAATIAVMRTTQVRRCTACGHSIMVEVRYPKYGADETPITRRAAQLKCSNCNAKRGEIVEGGQIYRYDGTIRPAS